MAGTLESKPDQELYGDLEVTGEVVAPDLGPSNNDLEKAGFMGSIMLAIFTLVRAIDLLSLNSYAIHKIIGPKYYSILPGLLAYAVIGLFLLFVSPWFTKIFVNRGAAGMGRLLMACVGWWLILLSAVPVTIALTRLPPVGYTANFFGDVFDPIPAAYGPACAGLAFLLLARFAPKIRVS